MAKPNSFRYVLRYKIDPAFHADERIDELVCYCRQSRTEEVMLFLTAEELSTGHPTAEELEPYILMAKRLKHRLADSGVALSLNPWTTTYHVSRGRRLKPGQDFTLMVGETGQVSPITACPLCQLWLSYICDSFARLVRELEPVAVWIEDDWRLHNHDAAMGWGGCFCPLHLARFADLVGRPVMREAVLQAILAPGDPHPWRRAWLNLWRDSLLAPAVALRKAIADACPTTRIGLMSSDPDVHSIEGRDWHALQEALGGQPAFLIRPHLPPYTETPAISTPPTVTRHTLANLSGPVEVYPELENSPRSGPYSKSAAYSLFECFQSAAFGSSGITINHFDMMGNGTALDPRFGPAMGAAKDKLNALAALGIEDRRAEGVVVLFRPDVATYRHSTDPTSMQGLHECSTLWGRAFHTLGVAHAFSHEIRDHARPRAVGGQTLRALSDEQVTRLLSGPVLLDAVSVDVLVSRGFGGQIGVDRASWRSLREVGYAYESICQEDPDVYGLANPRMTAQRCSETLLAMKPAPDAEVRSWIHRYDHSPLFPGVVVVRNTWGGRVASMAYRFDGESTLFMAFFNAFRRRMIHDLLFELAPSTHLAVADEHPMAVYRSRTEKGLLLAAFNLIQDTAPRLVLRLPRGQIRPRSLTLLTDQGQWQSVEVTVEARGTSERIILDRPIAPLEGVFLLQGD
ncbi:MAG: hypothetical protein JXQ73_07730 [Phycisphaerae bacterium]|nr:hypothetical protein [Phycisphaerae bacterium]